MESHDYWMGMAFMFAVRSKCGNASLMVENGENLIAYGLENPVSISASGKIFIPSHIKAILNCKADYYNAIMYCTSPPTQESALTIAATQGLKQIFYYPSQECDKSVSDLLGSVYCDISPYKCNLNWMRDYFACLEHK